MLFILTGDIQTGKTRWLQSLIDHLEQANVPVYGVVAPGVWKDHGAQSDYEGRYEKLGINNLLLPGREVVPFATRRDLALQSGAYCATSQSAQAQMGWEISDEAINQVNAHFCRLCPKARSCQIPAPIKDALGQNDAPFLAGDESLRRGLLVVDELGQLELLRNGGLTSALDVLGQGKAPLFHDALIVVRDWLVPYAQERFGDGGWGDIAVLHYGDEAYNAVFERFSTPTK